jgi:hypothetical protein
MNACLDLSIVTIALKIIPITISNFLINKLYDVRASLMHIYRKEMEFSYLKVAAFSLSFRSRLSDFSLYF